MNFLTLVQQAWLKCGLTGTGPSTVVGQTGMSGRIVQYVADAYRFIQQAQQDWSFHWTRVESASFVVGDHLYLAADLGASNLRTLQRLQVKYDGKWTTLSRALFPRDQILFDNVEMSGRPSSFLIRPNGQIVFDALPDSTYNVAVEYYRTAHELTGNTDTPLIPDEYQWAILFKAMEFYADFDEDSALLVEARTQYASTIHRLERHALPQLSFSESDGF